MGTAVYRARDCELNRTVAVKIPLNGHPNLRGLLRLKREVILASRVNHENVVRVHDLAEIEGKVLIVMDWVDGQSLASLLARDKRLPASQVFEYAIQMCEALRAIHSVNVVHQNFKPGNLLINMHGRILVGDFGHARSLLTEDSHLSQPGESWGTTIYMAPEQLASLPANARSDLYSLGVVLLEMLTGSTALEALAPLDERLGSVAGKGESRCEQRKLAALDRVIRRCLRPDYTERYASADEVLIELKAADLEPAGATIALASAGNRSKRGLRSRLKLLAAAATLLLGLAWLPLRGYILRLTDSKLNPGSADESYLRGMALITVRSSESDLRKALEAFEQALAKRPKHLSTLRARVEALIRLNEKTQDVTWLEQARISLQNAVTAGLDRQNHTLFRARIDLNAGSFPDVIRNLQAEPALLSSSDQANLLLGRALEASDDMEQALRHYRTATRLSPESWLSHNELGSVLLQLGRLDEARSEFIRVTQLNPKSYSGFSNLGVAYLRGGDLAAARRNFETALQRVPSAESYQNLGVASYYAREYASSVPFFESAIRMRPTSDKYVAGLADALRQSDRKEAARDAYMRVLALLDRTAATRKLSIEQQCRRASALMRLGDGPTARSTLNAAARLQPQNPVVIYTSAIFAFNEGKPDAARRAIAEAISHGYPAALAKIDPDLAAVF
jgi:serine/threonine protein kinase/Flp pilus assembly protein TadD